MAVYVSIKGGVMMSEVASIESLRTPDERFAFIPGFPYAPHYVDDLADYEGLRLA